MQIEGEWACGEIWTATAQYEYEREDECVLVYKVGTLDLVCTVADDDDGWASLETLLA